MRGERYFFWDPECLYLEWFARCGKEGMEAATFTFCAGCSAGPRIVKGGRDPDLVHMGVTATPYSIGTISESLSRLDLLLHSCGERPEKLLLISNICAKISSESQNPLDVKLLTDPETKKASTLELTIFRSSRQISKIRPKWGINCKIPLENGSEWGKRSKVSALGFEPRTNGLKGHCSAVELRARWVEILSRQGTVVNRTSKKSLT